MLSVCTSVAWSFILSQGEDGKHLRAAATPAMALYTASLVSAERAQFRCCPGLLPPVLKTSKVQQDTVQQSQNDLHASSCLYVPIQIDSKNMEYNMLDGMQV